MKRIMDEVNPKFGWLAGIIDAVIKTYLLLISLVWISGGFAFAVGPVDLSIHKTLPLLRALVLLLLVRWSLGRFWIERPFRLSSRLRWVFMRLLEIGVAVHLVLIPIVWRFGEFQYPFFVSPGLGRSLGLIFLMLLIRFIMGRNLAGITMMISVCVSLLVILGGMEIFLRISDANKLHQPAATVLETGGVSRADTADAASVEATDAGAFNPSRNDGVHWTWGHKVINNRFGFREKEFVVPKPTGLFRIMILGDSLTWGAGLAPEQRYSDLLEKLFTEAVPQQPVEVLNFGFPGGPTVKERDLLEELNEEVEPDLIVVGFCVNDPQPRSENYSVERARLHSLYSKIAVLRHVGLRKTYAYLINRLDHVFARMDAIPSWEEALDRTYQRDSAEYQAFEEALSDIKRISDQRRLSPPVFALLISRIASDNPNPPYMTKWYAQTKAAAEQRGFVVVDPTSQFIAELTTQELPVNLKDGHPSAACNRIYARELFEVVQPLVLRSGDE